MNGKHCPSCVYRDTVRPDGSGYRCCTPERQRDLDVLDCHIPEAPLREIQARCKDAYDFAYATHTYIANVKSKSAYWQSVEKG